MGIEWDSRAGARERLYLLTLIGIAGDPTQWMYNSRTDRWSNGTTGYKVGLEAGESLATLFTRHNLSESAALALVQ